MTDDEVRMTQLSVADRVLPDRACTECERTDGVINYDDELTSEQNGARLKARWDALIAQGFEKVYAPHNAQAFFQKLCEPCSTRQPYLWVRDVPLALFREFLADPKRSYAWSLYELNELR